MTTEEMKNVMITLWQLLDDIDTAVDIFKPSDLDGYKAYASYVDRKNRERFRYLTSDGYDLFSPEGEKQT